MWNIAGAGMGGVAAGYALSVGRSVAGAPVAEEAALKRLVNEFSHVTGPLLEMAQRLSDSLKSVVENSEGGAFKNGPIQLIKTLDRYIATHAQVLQSMQDLFADTGHSSRPEPANKSPHRGTFNKLRYPEPVSHDMPTQRVSHDDVYTDRSNPGKKPGVGNEPGNIWSGFTQGPTKSNCATIAAIKASMMRFGQKPTDIFKQVVAAGDGWDIKMRDSDRWYHLSKTELEQATNGSKFKGDNPAMVADANFLYAVSAKRAQVENNDGSAAQSYERALSSIDDGEPFGHNINGFLRLGLGGHARVTTVADLARGQFGLVTHGVPVNGQTVGHALAVINGREDMWGKQGDAPPTNANAVALD